jgi:hypothetical protein
MVCGAKAQAAGADMTTTKAIQAVSCGAVAVQHVAVCTDYIQRAAGGHLAQTQLDTHGTIFTTCAAAALPAKISFLTVVDIGAALFNGLLV